MTDYNLYSLDQMADLKCSLSHASKYFPESICDQEIHLGVMEDTKNIKDFS